MSTLVFPPPSTRGPLSCTDSVELRAAVALTASYVVTTHDVITMGFDLIVFGFDYNTTGADETTVEFYAEGFDGTTWRRLSEKSPASGGVAALGIPPLQWARTDFASGANSFMSPPFDTAGCQRVRGYAKKTGGTTFSALGISAVGVVRFWR